MIIFKIFYSVLIVIFISSCATIGSSRIHKIPINTVPAGAELKVFNKNNIEIANGTSPDTLSLYPSNGYFKRAEYYVHISKEGFESKVVPVYFVLNRKYISNIYTLFFMPIGLLIVDPISGAMWTPESAQIEVILTKK